jgi:flavin reductase (DIM6/NTAB) family NADH-FMN oxidoreductase RutF
MMDATIRKKTLRLLSNGVYIITSSHLGQYGAATVTWVSQASFKPPLIMAAIRRDSNVFRCLSQSQAAAIHIVDSSQEQIAQKFFTPTRVDASGINGESFKVGATSAPVLQNFPARLECQVRQILDDEGDHAIVVMEVVEARCEAPVHPLTIRESPWEYGG